MERLIDSIEREIEKAEKNGFELEVWMKKNFNHTGTREESIELLAQKSRYVNLYNDQEFIEKKGGGKHV